MLLFRCRAGGRDLTFLNAGRRRYNVAGVTFFSANPTCDPHCTPFCYRHFALAPNSLKLSREKGKGIAVCRPGGIKKNFFFYGNVRGVLPFGCRTEHFRQGWRLTVGCRGLPKWTALYIPNGCSKFGAERGGGEEETSVSTWSLKNDPRQCFCAGSCPKHWYLLHLEKINQCTWKAVWAAGV